MKQIIQRLIPSKLLNRLIPYKWKLKLKYLFTRNSNFSFSFHQAMIFVFMAADYGNLGDLAITVAQMKFLKDYFPNYEVVPIYVKNLSMIIGFSKSIKPSDIITIIGGGNMGDLYKGLEDQRRFIIKSFPQNKIISFPQTMDFKGSRALNNSMQTYSKHPDLHIFARESKSYEMMQNSFRKNHIYLVPDIVLYLNKTEPKFDRKGIILCLRADLEKCMAIQQQESLIHAIKQKYCKVSYYDTFIHSFTLESANREIENIIEAFKKAKVVITDRLHGMIFCAITQTPCVVFPNTNHKITATYHDWLSDLPFIVLIEKFDQKQALEEIEQLYHWETYGNEINMDVRGKFDSLLAAINS